MPSTLDDADLDARWRAGLEAASELGQVATIETRVAHHVTKRRRTRVGAAAACARRVVGVLLAGMIVSVSGERHDARRHRRTAGRRIGRRKGDRGPRTGRRDDASDAVVEFQVPDLVRGAVVGRRIAVGLEALGPGSWTLQIDDVPDLAIPVHGENQLNAASTLFFDLSPGVHPITVVGRSAPAAGADAPSRSSTWSRRRPSQQVTPVATVGVVSAPDADSDGVAADRSGRDHRDPVLDCRGDPRPRDRRRAGLQMRCTNGDSATADA